MVLRRAVLTLGIVALLGACASGPKYAEMKSKIPVVKSGEGRIYVFRDSIFGAAIQPKVYLNGGEVGASKANGFFYVDRPAGEYKMANQTEVERSLTFVLEPGETKYVRSSISFGLIAGRANFELAPAAEAQKAIEGLSYTGN
jgi:Protein of unknown function (DUF2846)